MLQHLYIVYTENVQLINTTPWTRQSIESSNSCLAFNLVSDCRRASTHCFSCHTAQLSLINWKLT